MSVEVKICGLTRPQDAAAAAASGASYLGVVFASGPRVVTPAAARAIVAAADGRPVLGVVGAASGDEILRLRDAAALSGVQLHGVHTVADAARLRREGLLVWRVARVAAWVDLAALDGLAAEADAVLVEPRVAHADGGSGVQLGLPVARAARAALAGCRMVLAGGLTAELVGEVVGLVAPDIVDVSSGVEIQPGIKDPLKMDRFVEAARGSRPFA
ncbi:MAG TPA: hypothetical protein VFW66_04680 [Gemmatimonadales bacterium]|nr:hypothetical protein [Gemmatimonadales bacterium]